MPQALCAVVSFMPMANDPRVNRQLQWLRDSCRLVALAPPSSLAGLETFDVGMRPRSLPEKIWRAALLAARRYESFYWQTPHVQVTLARLEALRPEIVIANDIETLPVCLMAQKRWGARVIFDAHEYYPELYAGQWAWRLLVQPYMQHLCRRYLPQADRAITVSPGLARLFETHFATKMQVIYNAPAYQPLSPRPTDPHRIRLIHHGYAAPDRYLESMIELVDQLDERFELTFMLLPGPGDYLAQLQRQCRHQPRIHFIAPVPMPEIIQTIQAFDIGVFLLAPIQKNYLFALPNKLFEFIQARLASLISPNPDMAALVRTYGCGWVSPDYQPASMARLLNRLSAEEIDLCRQKADLASRQLCAESQSAQFLSLLA